MPPAARISDMHVCPKVEPGPVPHVGGPTSSGEVTVIIGGMPAARVGDSLVCFGGPPDSISQGESTVIIGGKPAARLGDSTSHGGVLVAGCPTVIIGSSAQAQTLIVAAQDGTPFCEECQKKASASAKPASGSESPSSSQNSSGPRPSAGVTPSPPSPPPRRSLFDQIVDDANKVAATGGEITESQRGVLRGNLPVVTRRSVAQTQMARHEFNRNQNHIIQQWEQKTGRNWPQGATPHHIVPLESGGANKWYNIMPTHGALPNHSLPDEPGPHARGSVLRQTIQRGRRRLPPKTTTDLRKPHP